MAELVSYDGRVRNMLSKIRNIVRLTPHDMTTEEGRAKERLRRIALTTMASILAKVVSVSTMLISIPLTLHYLGPERYGMWMVISSFAMLLSFSDLGLGNGLLNIIARCNGSDDISGIHKAISSGYFALIVISAAFFTIFLMTYSHIEWQHVFNVNSADAISEAKPAMLVYATCFALAIPLGLIQRIQAGLQQGFNSSLWLCGSSILSLMSILAVIHFEGGLPWLVLGLVGAPLVANFFNMATFFYQRPELVPARNSLSLATISEVVRSGLLFLVLQIVVSVAYGADSIIITQQLGPAAVATYSVSDRMFSIITILVGMALGPLWPAYGEALARNDYVWVKKIFNKSIILATLIASLLSLIFIIFGTEIITLWVGSSAIPSIALLIGLSTWKIADACGSSVAMLLNGAQVVKSQIFIATFTGITMFFLKIYTVKTLGFEYINFVATATYAIMTLIPYFFIVTRLFEFKGTKK